MDTPKERIVFLLRKYEHNEISEAELQELNAYMLQNEYTGIINRYLDNSLSNTTENDTLSMDADKMYQKILSHPLFTQKLMENRRRKRKQVYYTKIAAAIALVLFSTIGYYYVNLGPAAVSEAYSHVEERVKPGTNKAILNTTNGQTVYLSDSHSGVVVTEGMIHYEDGTTIDHEEQPRNIPIKPFFYELETPRGGQYQITLEDGTHVYLNAASSLKYPQRFEKGSRTVELTGEAYFEVVTDQDRPFCVISKDHKVNVLGTKFNISAYEDEQFIATTLMEGRVRVQDLVKGESRTLKPGQETIYSVIKNQLIVQQADIEAASAWYRGYFDFSNQNIRSVMQKIARWYNVEVVFNTTVSDQQLEGSVSRFDHVDDVLAVLESTNLASFRLEGRKIIVNKPKDQ